jgi:hypothetical protein
LQDVPCSDSHPQITRPIRRSILVLCSLAAVQPVAAAAQDVVVMRSAIAPARPKAAAPAAATNLKCSTMQRGIPTTSNGPVTTLQTSVPENTADPADYAKAWCEAQPTTGTVGSAACSVVKFEQYTTWTAYLRYGPAANSNVLLPYSAAYLDRYGGACSK